MAEKKLTSSNILSLYSKTFTQKEIILNINNQTYKILIDEKFKPSKIQELIFELAEKQKQIATLNDVLDISYYAMFLIIKHFTSVDVAKCNDIETQLRVFKAIIDLEIFEAIMNAFDPKELEKVNKYISKMNKNLKELESNPEAMQDIDALMKEIASLENIEVFLEDEVDESANIQ